MAAWVVVPAPAIGRLHCTMVLSSPFLQAAYWIQDTVPDENLPVDCLSTPLWPGDGKSWFRTKPHVLQLSPGRNCWEQGAFEMSFDKFVVEGLPFLEFFIHEITAICWTSPRNHPTVSTEVCSAHVLFVGMWMPRSPGSPYCCPMAAGLNSICSWCHGHGT